MLNWGKEGWADTLAREGFEEDALPKDDTNLYLHAFVVNQHLGCTVGRPSCESEPGEKSPDTRPSEAKCRRRFKLVL